MLMPFTSVSYGRLPRQAVFGYQVGRLFDRLVDGWKEPVLGLGIRRYRRGLCPLGRLGDR